MSASLSVALSPEAIGFRDSVIRFCERALGKDVLERRAVPFSRDLWSQMAALGLLEFAATSMPDAMLYSCLGTEVLGYYGFPGPVAQAVAVVGIANEHQAAWSAGDRIPTFGAGELLAWAVIADDIVIFLGGELHLGRLVRPNETLGLSQSGVVTPEGESFWTDSSAVRARYDMAIAAYAAGAGRSLLDIAAEHARTRRQFGKPIGEFQAVAFPLAEVLMGLDAAQLLTRAAAMAIDAGREDGFALATAARLSATRVALKSGFVAHQTFGAYGVLEDGPVAWQSRRIQDYATLSPSVREARATLPLTAAANLDPELWPELQPETESA